MVIFRQVETFKEGQEEWEQYVEKLEQYFISNRVKMQVRNMQFSFPLLVLKHTNCGTSSYRQEDL